MAQHARRRACPRRLWRLAFAVVALIAIAVLTAAAVSVIASPAAFAAGGATGTGTGVLDGTVVNGSTGNAPIANQAVSLTLTAGAGTSTVASATTDAGGRFEFSGLATDPNDVYIVTAQVQGVVYSTDPVTLADNAHGTITLLAYDVTNSADKLGFSLVTYQFAQTSTDMLAGTVHVTELVNVVNGAERTFVGVAGPTTNGQPMSLLRFALPPGATDLTTHDGFTQGGQLFQVDQGFATTAPVPPGQTRFTFTYDAPYAGMRFALGYRAIYPTSQVLVIVPAGWSVTPAGFNSLGNIKAGAQSMAVWQATTIFPGNAVGLEMGHLPVPGQHEQLNVVLLDLLAGLLALAAFGAVAYALWARRGARATASMAGTGTATAGQGAATAATAANESASDVARAPVGLLKALAQLDRAHDAGNLEDEPYRIQRAALKERLKAQLRAAAAAEAGSAHAAASPADVTHTAGASDVASETRPGGSR